MLVRHAQVPPILEAGDRRLPSTIEGWRRYVGTVARFDRRGRSARGGGCRPRLRLEIENELTFGSRFLSINNCYVAKFIPYEETAIWTDLVRETADYATRHPDDFRGVTFVERLPQHPYPGPPPRRSPPASGR